jgi:hypothetical protein
MNKLITFLLLIFVSVGTAYAETVTLSTYYPAPFGAYDRLRLVPRAAPLCNASLEGLIYFDEVLHLLQVCTDPGGWQNTSGVWTQKNIDAGNADVHLTDPVRAINVGIGTITPDEKLHVSGTGNIMTLTESTNNSAVHLHLKTNSVNRRIVARDAGDNIESQIVLEDNGQFLFLGPLAANERMRISSSGKVGIGSPAPIGTLHIVDDSSAADFMYFEDTDGGGHTWRMGPGTGGPNQDAFGIYDGAQTIMTLDASNDSVGIGTTSPVEKLDVDGSIRLRDNGINWGKLMVEYNAAGGGGYYAVYAP